MKMEVQMLEELYYTIYLFGERQSKEEFLKMCMPERIVPQFLSLLKDDAEKVILMGIEEGAEKVEYNEKSSTLKVFTDKIPLSVCMECEYTDMEDGMFHSIPFYKYDKLLLLSYWQYEYSPLEDIIENEVPKILSETPTLDIVLVLLNNQIKTGLTDLGSQQDAINKAYQKYQEKYKDMLHVSVWGKGDSIFNLLHPKMEIGSFIEKAYCESFHIWSDRLKEDFLEELREYGAISEILDFEPNELEREVCGLKKLKGSKDIIKTFWNNFYQKYYEKAEDSIIADYKDFIQKVCVWDIEKDISELKKEMNKLYNNRSIDNIDAVYQAPQNQMEYNRLEESKGVKSKFYKSIQEYYREDVPNYLLAHLDKKQKKIRKQINQFLIGEKSYE